MKTVLGIVSVIFIAVIGFTSRSTAVSGPDGRETNGPPAIENEKPRVEMDKVSMERLHKSYVDTFIDEDGFGIRRVETMPKPKVLAKDNSGQTYRVQSMDLISFTNKVVYLASPNPHDSRHVRKSKQGPSRPLDDFETAALASLDKRELIWKTADDKSVRMVGAVRAVDDCLACHKVKEGDILGAFTYKLVPGGFTTAEKEMNRLAELLNQTEAKNAAKKSLEK